jgi:hypothetical protein
MIYSITDIHLYKTFSTFNYQLSPLLTTFALHPPLNFNIQDLSTRALLLGILLNSDLMFIVNSCNVCVFVKVMFSTKLYLIFISTVLS